MTEKDRKMAWENKTWRKIIILPKREIIDLLAAYDEYVYQICSENNSQPVGVCEFYEYDYQEYVKGEK